MNRETRTRGPTVTRSNSWDLGRWAALLLILLAFGLYIYDLGKREFWFDEAFSAYISGLGWKGALAFVRSSPFEHPPLYYLSLYLWQQFVGTSEFALRFYSVICGVLFLPLLYALIKRLANDRLALLAALLATLSPFLVAYSQEARMYTLLPCLAALTLLAFCKALERVEQRAWWLAYLLLLALGLATHYYFALVWVVTTLYLLLEVLHHRRARPWALVIQALIVPAAAVWVIGTPGLRDSLVRVGQGETTFSLAYKLDKVMPTLMLAEIQGGQVPVEAYVLALGGWLLILLGVWWSRRANILGSWAWRLLVLLLVIPLAGSLLIPYGVLGRHLGYILIPAFAFMALGLLALRQRGYLALTVGILAFLLASSYGLVTHYTSSNGSFGEAMTYVHTRGRPGDPLIMTQPLQWPLVAYYNDEGWPVHYLPSVHAPPSQAEVEETLGALGQAHDRLWLGPVGAWTADPESLVEQWLAAHAFQAEKVWFPDSTFVALYLPDDGTIAPTDSIPLTWGGRIRLHDLAISPLHLQPGGAIRLRFHWQAGVDLDQRYEVSLVLVDDQGLVWAERRSEPCGGWCPTDTWQAGTVQPDQHALVIPPGTPPGPYYLQVAWNPVDGGSPLQAEEGNQRVGQATLAEVTILPSDQTKEPWQRPNSLQVTFGGEVTLLGYQPATAEVRLGESLSLETHWRAETAPTADYALLVELVDKREHVVASWPATPSAASYPTSQWRAGEYVRGQLRLPLPGTLSPGDYELRIGLVTPDGERLVPTGRTGRASQVRGQDLVLASVDVLDRPRRFDPPAAGVPPAATIGRQAHLLGYDLDLSEAQPGGSLPLTLTWQAGGPMVRPFKVFAHLIDAEDKIWAQHDAPPGEGCCPANTWVEGEVIVDPHPMVLGTDLPTGTYQLVVGMYDQESGARVPAYDDAGNQLARDRVQIREIVIEPGAASGQEVLQPEFGFDYRVLLPLVTKGQSSK